MMPPKTEITKAAKSWKDRALRRGVHSVKNLRGGQKTEPCPIRGSCTFYVEVEKGDKGRGDTKVMFSRKPLHLVTLQQGFTIQCTKHLKSTFHILISSVVRVQ